MFIVIDHSVLFFTQFEDFFDILLSFFLWFFTFLLGGEGRDEELSKTKWEVKTK